MTRPKTRNSRQKYTPIPYIHTTSKAEKNISSYFMEARAISSIRGLVDAGKSNQDESQHQSHKHMYPEKGHFTQQLEEIVFLIHICTSMATTCRPVCHPLSGYEKKALV